MCYVGVIVFRHLPVIIMDIPNYRLSHDSNLLTVGTRYFNYETSDINFNDNFCTAEKSLAGSVGTYLTKWSLDTVQFTVRVTPLEETQTQLTIYSLL